MKVLEKAGGFGFRLNGLTYSPIKGPEGNIEYLAYLLKDDVQNNQAAEELAVLALRTVDEAYTGL